MKQLFGNSSQPVSHCERIHIPAFASEPAQRAQNVAVQNSVRQIEGDARDRGRRIVADAGQAPEGMGNPRKIAQFYNLLSSSLQIPRPQIITKAGPGRQFPASYWRRAMLTSGKRARKRS